jgi:hypothetical protein
MILHGSVKRIEIHKKEIQRIPGKGAQNNDCQKLLWHEITRNECIFSYLKGMSARTVCADPPEVGKMRDTRDSGCMITSISGKGRLE